MEALGSIEGLTGVYAEEAKAAEERQTNEKEELLAQLKQVMLAEAEDRITRMALREEEDRKRAEAEEAARPAVEAGLEREHRKKYERWKKLLEKLQAAILPSIEAEGKKVLGIFPRSGPLPYKWFSLNFAGQGDIDLRKTFDALMIDLFPMDAWSFANRMNRLKKTYSEQPEDKSRLMYDDVRQAYEEYLSERPYPEYKQAKLERTYVDSMRQRHDKRHHVGDVALDTEMRKPSYES